MGHKPWDRAWKRADKARERHRARAEAVDDMLGWAEDEMARTREWENQHIPGLRETQEQRTHD